MWTGAYFFPIAPNQPSWVASPWQSIRRSVLPHGVTAHVRGSTARESSDPITHVGN
jgi:hypothetical protein